MKLTEVLITVLISLCIVSGIGYAYTSFIKNYYKIIQKEKQNQVILSVDKNFRNEISEFCVPYYKKQNEERFVLEEKLRKIAEDNNCEVKTIVVLKKNNVEIGLALTWTYLDKKIITKEIFANRFYFEK